jgi:hypothetical protein
MVRTSRLAKRDHYAHRAENLADLRRDMRGSDGGQRGYRFRAPGLRRAALFHRGGSWLACRPHRRDGARFARSAEPDRGAAFALGRL